MERIMEEAKTQANFNGKEFVGLTEEEIKGKVYERLGNDWEMQ